MKNFNDLPADSQKTIVSLNRVKTETLVELSSLSLPEVEKLKHEIAVSLPKSNLPGLILAGLTNIKSRSITRKKAEDDINALFQGTSLLPEGLMWVLYGGPALVLSSYQRILELAGKDQKSAFPDGVWQFYVEFGLREDTGRHANETLAYHLERSRTASTVDDITAWIMTSIYLLFDIDGITANLWNEWTTLRLLSEAARSEGLENVNPFSTMLRSWNTARPYTSAAGVSYAEKRHKAFDRFSQEYFDLLSPKKALEVRQEFNRLAVEERPAYQRQMSLLARLEPGKFRDQRVPVPLWQSKIGLIWRGHTYLFDACMRDDYGRAVVFTNDGDNWPLEQNVSGTPIDPFARPLRIRGGWVYREDEASDEPFGYIAPPDVRSIKGLVQQIITSDTPPSDSDADLLLVSAPRAEQEDLRSMLPMPTRRALKELGMAPIIINWDEQSRNLPLGRLRRQARRGVGDHPLTIMRTDSSIVFDQSHVFFDGTWGMTIAEVMTNQAIDWCRHAMNADVMSGARAQRLSLIGSSEFVKRSNQTRSEENYTYAEAAAETSDIDLKQLQKVRYYLRQRGVQLTINDMLVLGRVFHAEEYIPSADLSKAVANLPEKLMLKVMKSVESSTGVNPSMLIPMDASFKDPRDRVYPTSFRNPLTGMMDAYDESKLAYGMYLVRQDADAWYDLDESRKQFFSYLLYFGELLKAIKAITTRGESFNMATIRLMGHLPSSVQQILDQIPQRVGILNEVVKGEEVFSNVGRVAAGSSLSRFISAKDDGKAKRLVWGILTDDNGSMQVTLRDFRAHVEPLVEANYIDAADLVAYDYVRAYADTVNRLVTEIRDLALVEPRHTVE